MPTNTTTLSNASSSELRTEVELNSPLASSARVELARRAEAETRLATLCRELAAQRQNSAGV